MYVYNVFGRGFGDDEDAWELSSTHATREAAEAARQEILDELPGLDPDGVIVEEQEVL